MRTSYNELFHCDGKCGRVQQDLAASRQKRDHLIKHVFKVLRQQLVRLHAHSVSTTSDNNCTIVFPRFYEL